MINVQTSNNKHAFKGILAILFYFFFAYYSPVFLVALGIDYDNLSTTIKLSYSALINILIIVVLIRIFREEIKLGIQDWKVNHKTYFKKYFKYWFLILFVMYTMNMLIMGISGNEIAENEAGIRETLKLAPLYAYISAVIFAPILEELVFRLSLRKIFPTKWLFIVISGLIFGTLHLIAGINSPIEFLYIIPYGFPGAVFAYLLVKTDNIMVPIGLHFIHNGMLMALQILVLFLT